MDFHKQKEEALLIESTAESISDFSIPYKPLNLDNAFKELLMSELTGSQRYQKVLAEIKSAKKDGKNPHFRSTYATLEACNAAVKPLVEKYELTLAHAIRNRSVVTFLLYKNEQLAYSELPIPDAVIDPQKIKSCVTYFKRTNLGCIFNLDESDDDGNAASIEPVKNKQTKKQDFF